MTVTRKLNVFLCHASQDKPAVRKLYARLNSEVWIDPWLDEERVLPGMDWDLEIQKALRAADLIIVCLSSESVAKEGYVQREFKRALSYAEEKPEGTIYIIPLRLNECTAPSKFQQWQWLDYFTEGSDAKLMRSLQMRAEKLGLLTSSADKTRVIPASAAKTSKLNPEPSRFTPGGRPVYSFGGMDFVKVASGDFYMGADDIEAASPQHLIYQLDYDFYIGRYPVTHQEYALYLRGTGQSIVMAKDKADHPIVKVSLMHAQGYADWLNRKYQADLPAGYTFQLPSEPEWEKSARGVAGNEYPWGNNFDTKRCNSKEGGKSGTTSVGAYSPQGDSAFGAADLAGNVWEWTRSRGMPYPYRFDNDNEDKIGTATLKYVLRGGSFMSEKMETRCAARSWLDATAKREDVGFRVVLSSR